MIKDLVIHEDLKRRYYDQGYWGTDTLNDVWSRQAAENAERTYVTDDMGHSYTYAGVEKEANKLAAYLHAQGIGNGDVVTFQMPKWAEFAIVYVACLKLGAVMHPVDIKFNDEDLVYAVTKVQSAAYIAPTVYRGRNYEDDYLGVIDRMPSIRTSVFINRPFPAKHPSTVTLSTALFEGAYCPAAPKPESKSDDVAAILSTSGSTGSPKMVLFTHNNILFSERSYISVLGLSKGDIMWMPSPLNHATGFYHGLISVMLLGGSTVLEQGYTPDEAIELINRYGCTWSHGATPFIFDILRILDETGKTLPSMRIYLCGGAPVPSNLIQRAHQHGILLCESYGSTESCPHVYVPPEKCLEWNGNWSGIPYEGIEVRVVDEQGNDVPFGEQGEEISRGPHLFVGYLGDPERTERAMTPDGWFLSGDLCFMDEQGRIRINGRRKEIIVRGGENISAIEVDQRLEGCPGIGDHATVGMPDERLGERICTFYVPKGEPTTLKEVTAWLAERNVPKRLWPERLEAMDRIPHTPTGKVQRFILAIELLQRMNGLK